MQGMKYGQGGIIANPNCSTIIALMAVTPLHRVGECLPVLCLRAAD
jgi:aspartate-semialdehyde dehydrogenase